MVVAVIFAGKKISLAFNSVTNFGSKSTFSFISFATTVASVVISGDKETSVAFNPLLVFGPMSISSVVPTATTGAYVVVRCGECGVP